MLKPARALRLHSDSGKELPRVQAFRDIYRRDVKPRQGQVIMVAGRSGTGKSAFAMYWVDQMNLPTLYFSADMSAFTASSRIACMRTDQTTEEVEQGMADHPDFYMEALMDSNITFSFGSPITWRQVDEELAAYVELWDAYPEVIVFDNLQDFENAESDYTEQMTIMSSVTELSRSTGSTVMILHHASDKTWDAKQDPWKPPARSEIKNGLAEKPELTLTVALDPNNMSYRVACVKQRMGPSDPSGNTYGVLRCEMEKTKFHDWDLPRSVA